ncbi:hypothetical protein, partial [Serratia marcescens]|uniref:hypothetical protein n=1 Tax=Serratia marcescens TaxID=615 RepID=UPI001980F079
PATNRQWISTTIFRSDLRPFAANKKAPQGAFLLAALTGTAFILSFVTTISSSKVYSLVIFTHIIILMLSIFINAYFSNTMIDICI